MNDTPTAPPARPVSGPLTTRERMVVTGWTLAPIVVAGLVLTPFAVVGRSTAADVMVAAMVYGGLVALATGFVSYDRIQSRQCPRCTTRPSKDAPTCPACDYDMQDRPRWQCSQRHPTRVEAGLCDCGRRLHRIQPRGVGREVVAMLKIGVWLLVFLLAVGFALTRIG